MIVIESCLFSILKNTLVIKGIRKKEAGIPLLKHSDASEWHYYLDEPINIE